MTGAVVAAAVMYPVILDNFESGNLSKWLYNAPPTWTVTSSSPVSGTYSGQVTPNSSSSVIDALWFVTPTGGRTGARGEILSVITSATDTDNFGLVVHGINYSPSDNRVYTGYVAVYSNSYGSLTIYEVSSGTATSLGTTSSITTSGNPWKMTAFVNPSTHPTNPSLFKAQIHDVTGTTLLGEVSATVTSNYSFADSGIACITASKTSNIPIRFDNFILEGKN